MLNPFKPNGRVHFRNRRARYLSAGLLVGGAFTAPSLAQGNDVANSRADTRSDTIIVTAQKREQSAFEVPFSVQALEGERLSNSAIRDLSEIVTIVPGASEELSTNVGFRRYQLRGIAQGPGDQTIGYYFDDSAFFLYGLAFAPVGRAFDMERVEVLRGPQSTLYGNGSMGGTIRFIPNAPDANGFSGQARVGASLVKDGEAGYYLDGAINLPLIEDELAVRFVVSHEEIGGYQEIPAAGLENINDASVTNLRASILWTPTDAFSAKFQFIKNDVEQDGGTLLAQLDPTVNIGQPGDLSNGEYELYSGTIEYELPFALFTNTATYIDFDSLEINTFPFPALPGGQIVQNLTNIGDAFNNEARLASNWEGPFDFLFGVYYATTDLETTFAFDPAIVPPSPQTFSSDSISIFGEVSVPLLDDRMVPLVGLRYFRDERSTASPSFSVQPDEEVFDSVNPRFNLSFLPNDSSQIYINVAKGFRSGGFNNPDLCGLHATLGGLPCQVAIDSDTLWSYEIGAKTQLFDRQVNIETALYYQDWSDIRQRVPFAGIFQEYQVGDAEIYGVDVALAYQPIAIEGLSFDLSANWNSAEFDRIDPALLTATGAQTGDRLPFVPDWTLATSIAYSTAITNEWNLDLFGGYSHIAPQLGQFSTNALGDARDLVRVRAGVRADKVGLHFFAKNLFNEDGAVFSQTPAGGVQTFSQDYPRQLGIELSVRW